MNTNQPDGGNSGTRESEAAETKVDPALEAALKDFRASVHAWSEASYRSRTLVLSPVPRRTAWQRSVGWALTFVLALGIASTGTYQYHEREVARQAAQREAEHQRQLALEQHARDVDDLLAKVDSDVSREVPSAMEPLASLVGDDNTQ